MRFNAQSSTLEYYQSMFQKKKYKILQDISKEQLKWIIQIDKNKEGELLKMIRLLTLGEGNLKKIDKDEKL